MTFCSKVNKEVPDAFNKNSVRQKICIFIQYIIQVRLLYISIESPQVFLYSLANYEKSAKSI